VQAPQVMQESTCALCGAQPCPSSVSAACPTTVPRLVSAAGVVTKESI
jgi:hypothetical protein